MDSTEKSLLDAIFSCDEKDRYDAMGVLADYLEEKNDEMAVAWRWMADRKQWLGVGEDGIFLTYNHNVNPSDG